MPNNRRKRYFKPNKKSKGESAFHLKRVENPSSSLSSTSMAERSLQEPIPV